MSTARAQSEERNTIIVVGDWFIDEYWFLTPHRSAIASHTGPVHYRIVSQPTDAVRDVCGAGAICRVLYELRKYKVPDSRPEDLRENLDKLLKFKNDKAADAINQLSVRVKQPWPMLSLQEMRCLDHHFALHDIKYTLKPKSVEERAASNDIERNGYQYGEFQLIGIGKWSPHDDQIIPHLVHAHCQSTLANNAATIISHAHFCINVSHHGCEQPVHAKLINLAEEGSNSPTIRVVRAYRLHNGVFDQLHQIDWEPAPKTGPAIEQQTRQSLTADKFLKDDSAPVIAIDDHLKGVINETLIQQVEDLSNSRNFRWFIRTKNKAISRQYAAWPQWLKRIKTIELLTVGPEIATRHFPAEALLYKRDQQTYHSWELIEKLLTSASRAKDRTTDLEGTNSIRNLILVSETREVIAIFGEECFAATTEIGAATLGMESINWTTALFAGLTYEMAVNREQFVTKEEAIEGLKSAIGHAHAHSGVRPPDVWELDRREDCLIALADKGAGRGLPKTTVKYLGGWTTLCEEWKHAREGLGLIKSGGTNGDEDGRELQLWRAKTDLPGYIAWIEQKRAVIREIWELIQAFKAEARKSTSVLLEADPGHGKSFLVQKLAARANLQPVQANISQMVNREGLFDLFDMIQAKQTETKDERPVFVFVDEINSTLGGAPVYGSFLAPLEDGVYLRGGRRFELKPCVWMFAGTPDAVAHRGGEPHERPSATHREERTQKEKLDDFESRLSIIKKIDYKSLQRQEVQGNVSGGQNFGEKLRQEFCYRIQEKVRERLWKRGSGDGDYTFRKIEPEDVRLVPPSWDDVLEALITLDHQARLEQVYMAVEISCKEFGDVRLVDVDLIRFFYGLDPASSPTRGLKRLATSLENVQYGRLHKGNCSGLKWKNSIGKHIPHLATKWGTGPEPSEEIKWVAIRQS